jgi:hypothetical protein
MTSFPPDTTAIDVRFHITTSDLPGIVQVIEELPEGFPTIEAVEFPASPIEFGASIHDPEIQEKFDSIGG